MLLVVDILVERCVAPRPVRDQLSGDCHDQVFHRVDRAARPEPQRPAKHTGELKVLSDDLLDLDIARQNAGRNHRPRQHARPASFGDERGERIGGIGLGKDRDGLENELGQFGRRHRIELRQGIVSRRYSQQQALEFALSGQGLGKTIVRLR
ncbi:MAG: hypothetical protein ACYC8V_04770 [Caulobacteraceae bacterium]